MKFVHIADIHLDTPFKTISDRADIGIERRLEQRNALKKVIDYIKANNIEYLFISGDLYDQEYIRESSISFLNDLFKEIPNTKIFITPGNHDPYIKNSFYATYSWNNNVKIFTNAVEKVENDNVNIYGFGFNNFEMNNNQIKDIILDEPEKINILITHGDLGESKYNPMNLNEIKSMGFDYVALGHIHKRDDKTNIIYPGSLISLGFDELGEHGMIVGEIIDKKLNKEFIKIDEREFVEFELDVSNIISEEELIEKIKNINEKNKLYKIILIGYRNFPINIDIKLINKNIIKIKDNTKLKIDFKENNNTLKGLFIKKLNERKNSNLIDEKTYEDILEIAEQALGKNK